MKHDLIQHNVTLSGYKYVGRGRPRKLKIDLAREPGPSLIVKD